jgi:hypothetical protein
VLGRAPNISDDPGFEMVMFALFDLFRREKRQLTFSKKKKSFEI